MSGNHIRSAETRPSQRRSRLYGAIWGEAFAAGHVGYREWRANADVGFRPMLDGIDIEVGVTGGWNYQTRDLGGYVSVSFSPGQNLEIVLRGHGGFSWGEPSSVSPTLERGYHLFGGFHAGYRLSQEVAAVLHVDIHYNDLVPPNSDVHANLGFEFDLSPVTFELGAGVDGEGGLQFMTGASVAFNLFPAETHHNPGSHH